MKNEVSEETPQTAKKCALARDDGRCAVTKALDWDTMLNSKRLAILVRSGEESARLTRCAYIFPQSTNVDVTSESDEAKHATPLGTAFGRFGQTKVPEELNGARIHRLENVITMEATVHYAFQMLQLLFTATLAS